MVVSDDFHVSSDKAICYASSAVDVVAFHDDGVLYLCVVAVGLSSLLRWKVRYNFKNCFISLVVLTFIVYLFRSLANLI